VLRSSPPCGGSQWLLPTTKGNDGFLSSPVEVVRRYEIRLMDWVRKKYIIFSKEIVLFSLQRRKLEEIAGGNKEE